ncbi:MAG TPA: histidine kinase dimerization/phospho-acceptor domain-containing protein [Candidatus Polarisedimenticolia bacterium]|nr:histidine kinase dimerization/phospho-acceptor domain-containing protein [Candidatus Polarisedimenticolia bacterium]
MKPHGQVGVRTDKRNRRPKPRPIEPAAGGDPVTAVVRLANAAAHEINNPLTVIIGNLELVARDAETTPFAQARVQAALEAAEGIREVVHCMHHVARLEVVASRPNLPDMLDLWKSSGLRSVPAVASEGLFDLRNEIGGRNP